MQKFPLRRREVVRLLEANGFAYKRTRGSHLHYEGLIDGQTRYVDVDQGIREFPAERHRVLGHILSQLGFFNDDRAVPPNIGWERFYAGEKDIARRARVAYRRWHDPHWKQWYK